MTRRWQREIETTRTRQRDATAKAKAIDAEREAAIRRSDYYDGDAIAWLADVDPRPSRSPTPVNVEAGKQPSTTRCARLQRQANGEPNG
jgi:hypothetical protein